MGSTIGGKPARSTLRFESLDEVLAEAERLSVAERNGTLVRAGNWTLGQTLGHLATWCRFAFDGYPPEVRAPSPASRPGAPPRRR